MNTDKRRQWEGEEGWGRVEGKGEWRRVAMGEKTAHFA